MVSSASLPTRPLPRLARDETGVPVLPDDEQQALLALARHSIAQALGGDAPEPPFIPVHADSCGVFVTLRTLDGELRGCVGRVEARCGSLAEEIRIVAVSSATEDPRFDPMTHEELDEVAIEISLLGSFQPVSSMDELDPARFGLVMSWRGRRGLLLPEIPGIDTPAEQVVAVARKAGIFLDGTEEMHRFGAFKFGPDVDVPQGVS